MAGITGVAASLVLVLLLLRTASSSNTTFYSCSPTDAVSPNSTYQANLRSLLSSLPSATAPSRFANLSLGSAPDRVFGLALCRGDTNSSVCLSCLTAATSDALDLCPGSHSAAVFYDLCRLRFSNTRFFSTLTPNPLAPYVFSLDKVNEPANFHYRVGRLLANLRDRAAFGDGTGFYASGWLEYGQEGTLFGLVQCTRDLSDVMCAQCLEEPIREITCCGSSVEIIYQGGSCYLRYAFYLFFNDSVAAPPPMQRPGMVGNASATDVGGAATGPPQLQQHKGRDKFTAMVVGIVVGGAILLVVVALIAVRTKRRARRGHILLGGRSIDSGNAGLMFGRLSSRKITFQMNPRGLGSRSFDMRKLDLQGIKVATDNFSEAKKVGKGRFGPTYKGELPGHEFIVKRITAIPREELEVIKREFKSFTKLEHPNVVKLLTFYMGEENLLVYEYLPNDSLGRVLFDNKRKVLLDWGRRFKIIQGIAQGILFLQGDSNLNLIHQNLKASNILLDKHMVPKISGFCLPKFFTACDSTGDSRRSLSRRYVAPETSTNRIYTSKTDVYSFGVLVLEIITGQRHRALLDSENAITLLNYVWQYWKDEKAVQVLDWSLGELYKKHEVLRCIHVGLLCVQEDPEKRPSVSALVHMLSSFSYTPPCPSPPAKVRAGKSNPQPKDDNSESSGHWDLKFSQAAGRVTPR